MKKLRIHIEGEFLKTWITSEQEFWTRSEAFREEVLKKVSKTIDHVIKMEAKKRAEKDHENSS